MFSLFIANFATEKDNKNNNAQALVSFPFDAVAYDSYGAVGGCRP